MQIRSEEELGGRKDRTPPAQRQPFWCELTIVSVDADVAGLRVEAGADEREHGQLLHFLLVGWNKGHD